MMKYGMRIHAICLMLIFTAVLTAGCGLHKRNDDIESVKIHYSGGLSGHFNDDLNIFGRDGKLFINFSTTEQDTIDRTEKEYEITEEEFRQCTEMLDPDLLPDIRQTNASDAIYYTVTIKEKGKNEVQLERIIPGCSIYRKIEDLWKLKNGEKEYSPTNEYLDKFWTFFSKSNAQNAILRVPTDKERNEFNPMLICGYGFDLYYPGQSTGYTGIIDELYSELVEMMPEKNAEDLLKDYHIRNTDISFFNVYPSILYAKKYSESGKAILDSKFEKTQISGKTVYSRILKSGDIMAYILIDPETRNYRVFMTDNAKDKDYIEQAKKLLSEGFLTPVGK